MYSIAIAKDKYEHVKCDQTYFKKEKREHYEKKRRIPRTKVKEQRNSSLAMYIYY